MLAADLESQDRETMLEPQAAFLERNATGICLGKQELAEAARFAKVSHRNRQGYATSCRPRSLRLLRFLRSTKFAT